MNGHTIDRGIATGNVSCFSNGEVFKVNQLSSLTLKNGTVQGGGSTAGAGGIHMKSDSTVTLDNVTLRKNWAVVSYGTDGYGGGVMMDWDASYIFDDDRMQLNLINGSKICENWAQDDGGGVYVNGTHSVIYMDSTSSISNNESTHDGGGVYIDKSGSMIVGGSITNNGGRYGGGVYVNDSNCSLTNVSITGNVAGADGGGVYVDSRYDLGLSGVITINNNTATSYPYCNNLCLQDGGSTKAYIVGAPSVGSKIGISRSGYNETFKLGTDSLYDEKLFFSDFPGFYVYWDWNPSTEEGSRNLKYTFNELDLPYRPNSGELSHVNASETTKMEVNGYTNDGNYDLVKGVFSYASVEDKVSDKDARFYYSDGYFAKDPSEYNEHLATMSLCLAMSAFGTNAGGDTDYTNKSAHVTQLLADIGADSGKTYVSDTYTVKPGTDTIGVTIGSKKITIGSNNYTLIPIAIRGAGYESEWASNVTVGTSGEHQGFADAADQVTKQVEQYISKYGLQTDVDNGKVKFWVVGYSRAGATANLTSRRLTDKYSNNQVYGYDFEAPQGGSESVATGEYKNIHNIINEADLVPVVAPTQMGLKRYGVDHYVPGDSTSSSLNVINTDGVTTYTDNNSYKTKANNGATESNEKYKSQRTLMLEQLAAVSSDVIFDDYFQKATIDYLAPSLKNLALSIVPVYTSYSMINEIDDNDDVAEWEKDFFVDFQKWVLRESKYGSSNDTSYRNCYANQSIGKYTYQDALRIATKIVFGRSDEEVQKIMNIVSTNVTLIGSFSLKNITPFVSKITKASIYDEVIRNWDKLDSSKKNEYIWYFWNTLLEPNGTSIGVTDILKEDATRLKEVWPTLCTMIIRLLHDDYCNNHQNDIGTLAYNATSIMQAHYPEVNMAWLRSYDSFYDNDKSQYVIDENDLTIDAPTATIKDAKTGETSVTQDQAYIGKQLVYLDSTNVENETIYFKISSTIDGKTTESDWRKYSSDGILLNIDEFSPNSSASYTIQSVSRILCNL